MIMLVCSLRSALNINYEYKLTLILIVTMLSIFASNAIALPLSPAFPTSELQYIMDNSSAKLLLATEKYAEKADQILVSGLDREPIFDVRSKIKSGSNESIQFQLEHTTTTTTSQSISGMMLYTSGTTNRPVRLNTIHSTALNY